jgi:hypothetical protein
VQASDGALRDTRGVARVNASFTMDVPPEQAQAMFVRDLLPDLHKDAGFILYEERPGRLELSKGVVEDSAHSLTELADPDVVHHPEEIEEPELKRAEPRAPADAFQSAPGGREGPPGPPVYSEVRRWISRRLDVEFAPEGTGTRVTLKGHAERDVRDALGRLGSPGHWPATANDPHD